MASSAPTKAQQLSQLLQSAGLSRVQINCIAINSAGPGQVWVSPASLRAHRVSKAARMTSRRLLDSHETQGRDVLVTVPDGLLCASLCLLGRFGFSPVLKVDVTAIEDSAQGEGLLARGSFAKMSLDLTGLGSSIVDDSPSTQVARRAITTSSISPRR